MSDPLIGSALGDYLIENRVGKGGMGVVYAARQLSLERTVAIKVLPAELCADREYVDRFLREARAAAQLNHPNIIQIFDAGVSENIYFFVMEFMDGRNFGQLLRERGVFAEREALHAIQQAAVGLAFAHSMGVVHRDVKPENIMISQTGLVKIGDLGLAKWKPSEFEASLTMSGTTMGTPFYISPEQIRGAKDIDARADIYSLGMTLFHLLAGRPAFGEGSAAEIMARHLSDPLPSLRALRPEISEDVGHLLAAMTAKDRSDRMKDMDEVVECMSQMLGHPPAHTPRGGLRPPPFAKTDEAEGLFSRVLATGIRGVFAGIVGLLIALATILAWKKLNSRPSPPALSPPSAEITPPPPPAHAHAAAATKQTPPAEGPASATPVRKAEETPKLAPPASVAASAPAPSAPAREIRSRPPRESERPKPAESAMPAAPSPEAKPASVSAHDLRPATRELILQGAGVFSSLVISSRADAAPLRPATRWGPGGATRWGSGERVGAFRDSGMLDLVVARGGRPEARTLLRIEFLARDPDLARRFYSRMKTCVAATLELTPIKVSNDARDLDFEVCRMLVPWGGAELPEIEMPRGNEAESGAENSSRVEAFVGVAAQLAERQEMLKKETDWKYASRSGGHPKAWNREGADGGGFDRDNTPLTDASNANRDVFRVSERDIKPIALNVLPEFQRLAEQSRDDPNRALHYGWILLAERGAGEVRFAGLGEQAPRLRFLFGKKEAPAR